MKKICFIAWLIAASGGMLRAQTIVNVEPKPARGPTVITSHRADFSNTARQITYTGDVRVDDTQMILTCDQLVADLPPDGEHIHHIVALTNVVIDSADEKGQTNHATSDKAVYVYNVQNGETNETITLTGNARAENAQITLTGEPITFNPITGSLAAINQHMIIKQNLTSALASTNSPAAKTNGPVAPKLF